MTNIQEYAQLKIEEKKISDRLKELKEEVTAFVLDQDDEKFATELGLFELRNGSKKWKYSDELTLKDKQVKEKIKSMKTQEELSGTAEMLKAPTNLVFTVRKA